MTESNEPKSLDETFRKYAWDYFALHADHRLRAFHFYILISGALTGVFATSIGKGEFHRWTWAIGVLLIFFSFVFWKMDLRTRQLVKNAENALMFLDAQHGLDDQEGLPHPLRVFSREQALSHSLKLWSWTGGHFSYARCFRWVFAMFALVGAIVIAASLAPPHPQLAPGSVRAVPNTDPSTLSLPPAGR